MISYQEKDNILPTRETSSNLIYYLVLLSDDNFRTKDMDPKHEYRYSQGIDVFFFHVPLLLLSFLEKFCSKIEVYRKYFTPYEYKTFISYF